MCGIVVVARAGEHVRGTDRIEGVGVDARRAVVAGSRLGSSGWWMGRSPFGKMCLAWLGVPQVKFPLILDMKEYCTEEYQAKISAWREKVCH